MSKNFVSTNFKYFKDSNFKGLVDHILRNFKENINAFPKYTPDNFGNRYNQESYQKIYDKVNARKAELKLKRLNKTSNTHIDGAFSFSLDRWEELEKEYSKSDLKDMITERMNKYMGEFRKEFGFEPIGWEMHLDEGFEKQIEEKKNNPDKKLVRNIHAHVGFFNYNFKNDRAPLRKMTKKDWSKTQDIAAKHFLDMGFIRGVSKENTKKNHLSKDDYIQAKQLAQEILIKEKEKNIIDLKENNNKLTVENELLKSAKAEERKNLDKYINRQFLGNDDLIKMTVKDRLNQRKKIHVLVDNILKNVDRTPLIVPKKDEMSKNWVDTSIKLFASKTRKETDKEINNRLVKDASKKLFETSYLDQSSDKMAVELEKTKQQLKDKNEYIKKNSNTLIKNTAVRNILNEVKELKEDVKELELKNTNKIERITALKNQLSLSVPKKEYDELKVKYDGIKEVFRKLGDYFIHMNRTIKDIFIPELIEYKQNIDNDIVLDSQAVFEKNEFEYEELEQIEIETNNNYTTPANNEMTNKKAVKNKKLRSLFK
jgi:hypothetical protein